ncbi:MAG: hypothetical protein GY756_16480 [bacterium]|nr:hypothetical protein [bacterium]
MNIGEKVLVHGIGICYETTITGETSKFWKVKSKTGSSEEKYSKSTLKKCEYPYFDGFYIGPLK